MEKRGIAGLLLVFASITVTFLILGAPTESPTGLQVFAPQENASFNTTFQENNATLSELGNSGEPNTTLLKETNEEATTELMSYSANASSDPSQTASELSPLANEFIATCRNLNVSGTRYLLTTNVSTLVTCFTFTADNIVLDCQGYNMTGDGGGADYGVNFNNRNNVTVRNCHIHNFNRGITTTVAASSKSVAVHNVNITSCYMGVHLQGGIGVYPNANVTFVRAIGSGYGFYVSYATDSSFSDIYVSGVGGASAGIYFNEADRISVRNYVGVGSGYGLQIHASVDDFVMDNFNISASTSMGFYYSSTTKGYRNRFSDGYVTGTTSATYAGIRLSTSQRINLTNVTIMENAGDGLDVRSYYVDVTNCTIKHNVKYDITNSGQYNRFIGNYLTVKNKVYAFWAAEWNNSVNGNHWELYSDDCEGCYNSSGFCNVSYTISANNIDYKPYYDGTCSIETVNCNTCANCTALLQNKTAYWGDTLNITNNLTSSTHCIQYSGDGINFECNGHTMTGDGGAGDYGFYLTLNGVTHLTSISNCIIDNFGRGISAVPSNYKKKLNFTHINITPTSYGLYLDGASGLTLNTTINDLNVSGGTYGIYLDYGDDSTLSNIRLQGATSYGAYISYSDRVNISDYIADNCNYGFYTNYGSDNLIIDGFSITDSTTYGMYFGPNNPVGYNYIIRNGFINNTAVSDGIYISYVDNVNITNVTITNNNQYGINCKRKNVRITNSTIKYNTNKDLYFTTYGGHYIHNNQFYNGSEMTMANILSAWNLSGFGNQWELFDSEGEGCFDRNGDGVCDDANMTINAFNIDYRPLYGGLKCGTLTSSLTLNASVYGATTCYTIANDNIVLDCAGHSIIFDISGTGNDSGVLVQNHTNITIRNCIIKDGNISGADSSGVKFENSANNTVRNCTMYTNGTSRNLGVAVLSSSDRNSITNNTIHARGTANLNSGIRINSSDSNNVSDNRLYTNGTSQNYGILLGQGSHNILRQNTISTNGTSTNNTGIMLNSSTTPVFNTSITNNTITTSGTSGNHGLHLILTNATKINLNRITTSGTTGVGPNYGIYLDTNSNQGNITLNTISATGGNNSHGIYIKGGNNTFTLNQIATNSTISDGIAVNGSNNTFLFNNITTYGNNSYAISLFSSSGNEFLNNTLYNPMQWLQSYTSIANFSDTLFITAFGSINFTNFATPATNVTVNRNELNLSNNTAFLNSSAINFMNVSATITLNSIPYDAPNPAVDFNDDGIFENCTICTNITYNATTDIFIFSTPHFTTYKANGTVTMTCPLNITVNTNLTNDMTSQGDCIQIMALGVILDCKGFSITGNGSGTGVNSVFGGAEIRNCHIDNFSVNVLATWGSTDNLIINNTLTNATQASLRLQDQRNNITDNYVHARQNVLWGALDLDSANNIFRNNTFVSNASAILLNANSAQNQFFNTTIESSNIWMLVARWLGGAADNLTNTTFRSAFGSIKITSLFNVSVITANVSTQRLNISNNSAFLNSTNLTFMNTTARITLNNINFTNPRPTVDPQDDGTFVTCLPPQCTEVNYTAGTFIYDVTGFTTYSSEETSGPVPPPPQARGAGGGGGASYTNIVPQPILQEEQKEEKEQKTLLRQPETSLPSHIEPIEIQQQEEQAAQEKTLFAKMNPLRPGAFFGKTIGTLFYILAAIALIVLIITAVRRHNKRSLEAIHKRIEDARKKLGKFN